MTWRERYDDLYENLTKLYPHKDPGWRQRKAYKQTVRELGDPPPGLKWALVKLGWGLVKSGGKMDFSWAKNGWKAVRGGLGVVLAAALFAGLETLMQQIGNPEFWQQIGAPQFMIPVILAVLVSFRNWLKHKKRWNMP
jgi:hypothetical protein